MTQTEFVKGMTILTVAYPKFEVDKMTTEVWYSFFESVRGDIFIAAVKSFVRSSTFQPTVHELLKHCEEHKTIFINATLKLMWERGYFTQKGMLDESLALRNYDKANKWVERGIEPQWFKDDMSKYEQFYLNQQAQLRLEKL